jgi:hypothetical protein
VTIDGKKVICTCRLFEYLEKQADAPERGLIPTAENHGRGYGGRGTLSTISAKNGTPAAVSQAAGDYTVAFAKARLEDS